MKQKLTTTLTTVILLCLTLLCIVIPAPAAAEEDLIGKYGLEDYNPSQLNIVRDTTLNADGTISVTFKLRDELTTSPETLILLRFRYDTGKMRLTVCLLGDEFSTTNAIMSSGELTYTPYSVFVWGDESGKTYPASTKICTLIFSVQDTKASTDVFGKPVPYWWVDLGGVDTGSDRPDNSVTVYTPDSQSYYKVSLYEGVRNGDLPTATESLTFHITSDNLYDITVPTGTEITVSFTVKNDQDEQSYIMSRLQNEIYYDHEFFEFIEYSGSQDEKRLVDCSVRTYSTNEHRVYVNQIDDKSYSENQFVASFKLKVIATEQGASSLIETKAQKATKKMADGTNVEFSPINEKNLTVRIGNPVVTFDSAGGSVIDPSSIPVVSGKTVQQPENPTRDGFTFMGWYTSVDNGATLEETPYNFLTPVTSSFTLYAKWEEKSSGDVPGSNLAVKEIMLGTGGIDDPVKEIKDSDPEQYQYLPSDYLYLGIYDNTPVLWRVLDADKTNVDTSGMFLLSELLYSATPTDEQGTIYFADPYVEYLENGKSVYYQDETKQAYANDYQGSQVQDWCLSFATTQHFTQNELNAIPAVTKVNPVLDDNNFGKWTLGNLNNEQIFCLSAGELVEYVANYQRATALSANPYHGGGRAWWLRSAKYDSTDQSGMVTRNPIVTTYKVRDWDANIRPATNINLNAILFTSAAERSKDCSVASALTAIPDYTGNEWKATLYDAKRDSFRAEATSGSATEWTISYSGAVTGNNEYISAMVVDSEGNALYYGKLALINDASKASGTVTVTLPKDFNPQEHTLYIFNEQLNGDRRSDYAGSLIKVFYELTYTVAYEFNGGTVENSAEYAVEQVAPGSLITVKEAPTKDGHTFIGWINGTTTYQPNNKIRVDCDITLTAVWQEIVQEYTITYNLNGGTGTDYAEQTVPEGTEITIKQAPTRTGYTFIEWTNKTESFKPGQKITIFENTTFTAQWEKNQNPPAAPSTPSKPGSPTVIIIPPAPVTPPENEPIIEPDLPDKPDEPEQPGTKDDACCCLWWLLLILPFLIIFWLRGNLVYRILKRNAKEHDYEYDKKQLKKTAKEIKRRIRDKKQYGGWRKDKVLAARLETNIIHILTLSDYPEILRYKATPEIIKAAKGTINRYRL